MELRVLTKENMCMYILGPANFVNIRSYKIVMVDVIVGMFSEGYK